jgi:DNA-binding SARP family transcriptional activator
VDGVHRVAGLWAGSVSTSHEPGAPRGSALWTTAVALRGSARPLAVTTTDPRHADGAALDDTVLDETALDDSAHRCAPTPRYRLLGPPALRTADDVVLVPGARQMLLLALLALTPGRAVDGGFLCDAIWPLKTPHDPANALQSLVSRLRRLVGADAVVFAGSAYLLDTSRDDVDATAFEDRVQHAGRMLAGGAYAAARSAVHDAQRLWHAEPMPRVQDDPTVRRAVEHLRELRLEATVLQARAEIALGLHELTVPALRALTHEHPLREDVWALLVTALYRSGRTADSLAAYRTARQHLVRDLGLEPGPALRELERDILAGAEHLSGPVHPCASHARLLAGPTLRSPAQDLPPPVGPRGLPTRWQDFPAPRLFLDRVQLAHPAQARPEPDDQQAAQIVTLCRLLGGDPLAVELAAASLGSAGLVGLPELVARHRAATTSDPTGAERTGVAGRALRPG